MFTGIVEELGEVRAIEPAGGGARVEIGARAVLEGLQVGASIAVNGCCLTATELGDGWWAADAVVETLRRTDLGSLQVGDVVNLERPLPATGRLDGHIVQGHVDGVATLDRRAPQADGSFELTFALAPELTRYLVEKGSVAVDGVSLTVASVSGEQFTVALIPHTAEVTTLGRKPEGARVNVEIDVVAKYVERLVRPYGATDQPVDPRAAG